MLLHGITGRRNPGHVVKLCRPTGFHGLFRSECMIKGMFDAIVETCRWFRQLENVSGDLIAELPPSQKSLILIAWNFLVISFLLLLSLLQTWPKAITIRCRYLPRRQSRSLLNPMKSVTKTRSRRFLRPVVAVLRRLSQSLPNCVISGTSR